MQYPDSQEYITFLFFMLDTFSATQEKVPKKGRPETYSDASLIVFYAVMTLKGITAMRAQQHYLFHHPLLLERCRLPACPSHVTLGRRYKALKPKLEAFTTYVSSSRFVIEAGFHQQVVYEDKNLFKAAGPCGIRKTVPRIISPKAYTVLIKLRLGRKVGITDGVWIWAASYHHPHRVSHPVRSSTCQC